MQFWRYRILIILYAHTRILYTDRVKAHHSSRHTCTLFVYFDYSPSPSRDMPMRPEAQHVRFLHPRVQHVAAINDIHLQQLPTVLEMQDQWLIVLLAGLFPSARGFGSVRQGCCFELLESVEDRGTSLTKWTRSFCYGQHMGGWDPYSISKADCLEEAGVFRDCSQVCAPPLVHPRPRGCATPHQHAQPHQPHE